MNESSSGGWSHESLLHGAMYFALLPLVYTIEYGTMTLLWAALIWYLRKQRSTALRGSARAALKVILPPFEPMLWVFGTVSFVFFVMCVLIQSFRWPLLPFSIVSEAASQGQQFSVLFVGLFLHQKSVSMPAVVRTAILSVTAVTAPVLVTAVLGLFVMPHHIRLARYIGTSAVRVLLCGFFLHQLIRPVDRASASAIREFSAFAFTNYCLLFVAAQLAFDNAVATATYVTVASCAWMTLAPIFEWRLLKADTHYWRGLGQRMLIGHQSIQEVLSSKGLHVLLEMHRHDLLDFAHLDFASRIGRGASAEVYQGTLHSNEPVAIKVYSPPEISEATVEAFSQEAAVWAILDHPNVTSFYGLCVSPPTICLVSELCHGSLADLLSSQQTRGLHPVAQLCYMLDAARAVAYLHSFSPSVLHRDIKPSNFLLDKHHNRVKLTDFGESRLAQEQDRMRRMTVRGTVEYMAPEVIDGKQGHATYNTRADVFSLAMTFWDICHPHATKYPGQNHMHLFRVVLNGTRPSIRPDVSPALQELMQLAWHGDPDLRPSAVDLVEHLERLLEDECFPIVQSLHLSCKSFTASTTGHRQGAAVVNGQDIVRDLVRLQVAGDTREALRIGNALLDMGYLHDAKHAAAFVPDGGYLWEPMFATSSRMSTTSVASCSSRSTEPQSTSSLGGGVRTGCFCKQYAQGMRRRRRRNSLVRDFKKKRAHEDNLLTVELLHDHALYVGSSTQEPM
ncbi:hypothetical protein DYB25_000266 [Aphanomyces astaci]|uniref:Protein kinase domain-containing protein n=1 Tax=Aphanomyces astaci TaxID=112090 RepID=A0A397BDT9_APHAT|nr:hypothetical protein DYB36_002643 [Aphanomyces astaci]RHY16910.1 hypothetical protein DYB25_000266 [Aphanomyces astaci]RHY43322.1 hypothetical protein DYB38_001396 [Aphanomyces astaci]RHY58278.1 hypothetical protein DYB34_001266 [Aphanomyces astaci]RHY61602.1 hypothetical protein DYB30_001578 [Aphanomyces astaci]